MPFEQITPHPLIARSIHTYAPSVSGVYGISNAREWIFIGETDDIQSALLSHLQEMNTAVMQRQPTGFVFEACEQRRRSARQDRLVFEYEPVCNRRSARAERRSGEGAR